MRGLISVWLILCISTFLAFEPLKYMKKKIIIKTFENGYRGVFAGEDIKVKKNLNIDK
jgi:hypothetical protein